MKKLIFSPGAAAGLTAGIFLLDLFTPPGAGEWILYLAPPWLLYRSRHRQYLMAVAVVCTVLIGLGPFLSPPGIPMGRALLNRLIGVVMLWMTTAFLLRLTQQEDALRENEAKFRDLVEKTNDLFWEVDRKGKYTYCSPNVVSILGYAPGEFLGKTPFDFMPSEEAQRVGSLFGAIVAEQKSFSLLTHQIRYKDGRLGTMECSGTPVFDLQGQLIGYRGVDRDITERQTLESQLRQAQKMEAVGQLAGGVAHDFNNLLMVITGYCDLVLRSLNAAAPERESVAQIKQAGVRAAELTRQLLAFSRKQPRQPKPLVLNEVVARVVPMLKRLLGEDIWLVEDRARELGVVQTDPSQIEQVIVNLAINARDAMPQGGILTIMTANVEVDSDFARTHPGISPGPYVLLAISDTGTGMTEAVMTHIFEPFFTTKLMGKGTGLGLAMVYGIVKQNEGAIYVRSQMGRGTMFTIYFPRLKGVRATDEPTRSHAVSPQGTETILLVEDEEGVRNLICQALMRQGYRVLAAASGKAALALVAKHADPIHLLLTDIVMPEMSGRDLAVQLAVSRPDLKVLYMTGYTEDAIVRHGVPGPGITLLQKPFTPDALARKVREVLDAPLPEP